MRCRKVSSSGVVELVEAYVLLGISNSSPPASLVSQACPMVPLAARLSPTDTKAGQAEVLLAFCSLVFADSPFHCLSFRPAEVPLQETPSLANYVILILCSTSYQSHLSSCTLEAFLEAIACVHTSGSRMRASRHLAYGGSKSLISLVTLGRLVCQLNGSKSPLVISNVTHLSLG